MFNLPLNSLRKLVSRQVLKLEPFEKSFGKVKEKKKKLEAHNNQLNS